MNKETREEIKNFDLQNYIEIFILNIMIVLAIVGFRGERWAVITYVIMVCLLEICFMFSLGAKWKIEPSTVYFSIYFFNLLLCVAFGWLWMAACWFIILVCAGIGMDRYLKSEKSMEAEKDEN